MLALTYTHSRVSVIEGTLPTSPPPSAPNPSPYDYDDMPPPDMTSSSQPTLYHPNDSLYQRNGSHNISPENSRNQAQRPSRQSSQINNRKRS